MCIRDRYTNVPYPFAKYDFIILPGFQYGGMEHTGDVYKRQVLGNTLVIETFIVANTCPEAFLIVNVPL